MPDVRDNTAQSRFEMMVEGQMALADYRRGGGKLMITHVETPPALQGRGVAADLMAGVVEAARAEGAKIVPICSYAAAYMRRHKEHADLLA
jgi:predicted GNAT family acetyltransferase